MVVQLRLRLLCGTHSIPLQRVHHLTGFAALTGTPDEFFLGWLDFHGQAVPIFDLNRILCDLPSAEDYSSRILLIETPQARHPFLGLLATEVTDTLAESDGDAVPLDLDTYLPMLSPLIPDTPADLE